MPKPKSKPKHAQMEVRYVTPDELKPYERNARTHSDEQIKAIARSIETFGFNNPILIDSKRGIIAGHGRLLAARTLGMTSVPIVELAHLTDAQKRAYIIADNQLALQAGWDAELLLSEMDALAELGFDTTVIGFSETELAVLRSGWQQDWEKYNKMEATENARASIKVTCEPTDRSDVIEIIKTALEATSIEHVTVE